MSRFYHDGFEFSFMDQKPEKGSGEPVLLLHGFSSNYEANWLSTGWVKVLSQAGYRVVGLDNRGHGETDKSYDPSLYTPGKMAADALALMDHLGISRAHVMGYSMGARISAFLALSAPHRVSTLVFGGLGMGMIDGMGDWSPIVLALMVEDSSKIIHPLGLLFRSFADKTKSDRKALAACISKSRETLSVDQMASIMQPTLVAVGSKDDLAGSASMLASIMPEAQDFEILGKDHMSAVGDLSFKKRVLEFYSTYPLSDNGLKKTTVRGIAS